MKYPAFYGTIFTNVHHPTACCSSTKITEAVGCTVRIGKRSVRKRTLVGGAGRGGQSRLI
jgi:hypothetical protein